MSGGKFELFLSGGIGSVVGTIMTLATLAFKAGRRDAELATKQELGEKFKELDDKLKDYAKKDQIMELKVDLKADVASLKEDLRFGFKTLYEALNNHNRGDTK